MAAGLGVTVCVGDADAVVWLTYWPGGWPAQATAAGCELSNWSQDEPGGLRRRVLLCNKNKSSRSHQSGLADPTKRVKEPTGVMA